MAFKVMKIHAFLLLVFAGARLKVDGKENIPKSGAYIICPNHTSFIDIFCIYTVFKDYFVFTGKKEIEKWPLFHIYYTSGMNILVDRENNDGNFQSFKRMSQVLAEGKPLAIFPEGTISKKAPQLEPFKTGAFTLAIQRQVPILPISFVTNWKILQRGTFFKAKCGPGIARMIIHPPILTTGMKKSESLALQEKIENCIQQSLIQ
ncbi:MAG: 1-acyl-sn-glycerol-3-phosphate acyltransferase [Flavobacteriia bacterium]|nr:1-acyl-sn-glycerol-3-phosphate acyltransferase [Flavobacteriia bacterium]